MNNYSRMINAFVKSTQCLSLLNKQKLVAWSCPLVYRIIKYTKFEGENKNITIKNNVNQNRRNTFIYPILKNQRYD